MQSLSLPGYPLHFDYWKIFFFCVNIYLTFYFQSYYYTLSLTGYSTLTCSAFSLCIIVVSLFSFQEMEWCSLWEGNKLCQEAQHLN